jgi:dihydrofolate reductase
MINIIVATDTIGGIGYKDGLPWEHNKEDMKWFRSKTINSICIQGRKTYDSLPTKYKPLPDRFNIVLSKTDRSSSTVNYVTNMQNAITLAKLQDYRNINIIGGASVYEEGMLYADRIFLTKFRESYRCDTFMPEIDRTKYALFSITNIGHAMLHEYRRYKI